MLNEECRSRRMGIRWTLDQLATRAGVVEATIRKFEAGVTAPREGTLIALRKALKAGEEQIIFPAQATERARPHQAVAAEDGTCRSRVDRF